VKRNKVIFDHPIEQVQQKGDRHMSRDSGIPLGALWGLIVIAFYIYAYLALGTYLVWKTAMPDTILGWIGLIGSSVSYLIVGIVGFFPTSLIALYLICRDRNILATIRRHWPVFFLVIYCMIPNIPGPIDEILLAGVCTVLELYFIRRGKQLYGEYDEEIDVDELEHHRGRLTQPRQNRRKRIAYKN
jgi:hypothetical protein